MPERLRSLWFVIATAFRADPWRAGLTSVLVPAMGVGGAAIALWLKLLADAATAGRPTQAVLAAIALAVTVSFDSVLGVALGKVRFTLQERIGLLLERRLVELASGMPGLEHHERPEYLDRLEHLRAERSTLGQGIGAVVMSAAVIAQGLGTVALLASVHPTLLLLPLLGLPTLITSAHAATLHDHAKQATAEQARLASHYLRMATSLGPAKEVRLFGLRYEIRRRHQDLLSAMRRTQVQARLGGAAWEAAGSLVFVTGYVAAILFVIRRATLGLVTPGDVFLTMRLASQVNGNVVAVSQMVGWLQEVLLIAGHFRWFVRQADAAQQRTTGRPSLPAPTRLRRGLVLEHVSFRYPGTHTDVLHDVNLFLPAGRIVALVGDNGVGKSTLVKLLCGFYAPTSGSITVDGVDLADIPVDDWRTRLSGAFQDFCRFEFTAQKTVGVGDVTGIDNQQWVWQAVNEAGAGEVISALPNHLATQLGRTFQGVDLSEGQWQKFALARSRMCREPLLYVLDEPTASLDAESEHALFSQMTASARRSAEQGAITLLVSHRLSTVRDADLIVVLEQGRVLEVGSHAELLTAGRLYARLFSLQARAYQ